MNSKERVKALLSEKRPDLSIARLEQNLNISNGTIGKWDKAVPSLKSAQKVASFFNVSTDYLLCLTDDKNPTKSTSNTADLAKEGVFLYQGQEISDEQMEILKSIIDSWKKD